MFLLLLCHLLSDVCVFLGALLQSMSTPFLDVLVNRILPMSIERPRDAFIAALVHRRVAMAINTIDFWLPFLCRRKRELLAAVEKMHVRPEHLVLLNAHYDVVPRPIFMLAGLPGLVWSKMPFSGTPRPVELYQVIQSAGTVVRILESGMTGVGRQKQVARGPHLSLACFYELKHDGDFVCFVGGSRQVPDEPIVGKVCFQGALYEGEMVGECLWCHLESLHRFGPGTLTDRNGVICEGVWGDSRSRGRLQWPGRPPQEVYLEGTLNYHWQEIECPLLVAVDVETANALFFFIEGAWKAAAPGQLVRLDGCWYFDDEFEADDEMEENE